METLIFEPEFGKRGILYFQIMYYTRCLFPSWTYWLLKWKFSTVFKTLPTNALTNNVSKQKLFDIDRSHGLMNLLLLKIIFKNIIPVLNKNRNLLVFQKYAYIPSDLGGCSLEQRYKIILFTAVKYLSKFSI